MANTAEELGRRYGMTEIKRMNSATGPKARPEARDNGWFDEEIEPVEVRRDGTSEPVTVQYDTHIIDDVSIEKMARLRAAFRARRTSSPQATPVRL